MNLSRAENPLLFWNKVKKPAPKKATPKPDRLIDMSRLNLKISEINKAARLNKASRQIISAFGLSLAWVLLFP
jgi:hypothetical protein